MVKIVKFYIIFYHNFLRSLVKMKQNVNSCQFWVFSTQRLAMLLL